MLDVFFIERDPYAPIRHCYPVSKVLYQGKSDYQEIMVIESPNFGKVLVLVPFHILIKLMLYYLR